MKKNNLTLALLFLIGFAWGQTNPKQVHVQGYTKSNGSYVPSHMRTAPNNTNRDNFSTKPNINPYTGQPGWINPDSKENKSFYNTPSSTYPTASYSTPVNSNFETTNSSFFNNFDAKKNVDNTNFYTSYPTYETKSKANFRQEMSTSSAIIETLPKGILVKVINSFFGEWWEVYYNGQKGYMHSSLLSFNSSGYTNQYINSTYRFSFNNSSFYESYPSYKTINETSLRQEMSSVSAIIEMLPQGTSVKVINSFFGEWWEIYYNGQKGYIHSSFLSNNISDVALNSLGSNTTNTNTLSDASINNSSLYDSSPTYETKSKANLREEMSTSSIIIETLQKGALVKVINSSLGEWWLVHFDGQTGYMHNSLLSFTSDEKALSFINTSSDDLAINDAGLYAPYPTYKTKRQVNLREDKSYASALMETLPQGTLVKVINSLLGEWWVIYYNGQTGYINGSELLFFSQGSTANRNTHTSSNTYNSNSTSNSNSTDRILKTNRVVSLRATPNSRSIEIKLIGMYESVKIIGYNGDWVNIEYSNKSGWIEKNAVNF